MVCTTLPVNPAFAAEHARLVENHWVHAETWTHVDRAPRGTIVLLHGFGMGGSALDAIALMAPGVMELRRIFALLKDEGVTVEMIVRSGIVADELVT